MPVEAKVFNIYGAEVLNVHGHDLVYIEIKPNGPVTCPHCGNFQLRKKDKRERKVRHEGIGRRPSIVVYTSYKYMCKGCGKYFWTNPPLVRPRRRST